MMMDSDCSLNLMLRFDGSLQKVLTRTMVDQEEIFKNQICSSESVLIHRLMEHSDTLKHQQLSLDLELASSHYTNGMGDHLSLSITPEPSGLMKHHIYDDNYSIKKVLKLSLRADADTQQTSSGRKTCNEEVICSPSIQAIHLGESRYGKDIFTTPGCAYGSLAAQFEAKDEFKTSCSIRCRRSDAFNWISESESLAVGMENFLEREPSRRKPFASQEVGQLDLNKALPDETMNLIDPRAFNLSQSDSSLSHSEIADHGQATVLNFTKMSKLVQQEITASTVTTLPSKDSSKHICQSKLCSIDFGSVCRCLSGTKNAMDGFRTIPENRECGISLQEKTSQRISISKVDVEKKANKLHTYNSSQELHEGTDSNRLPVSCKSDCNTDDASSIMNIGCRDLGTCASNVSPCMLQNPKSSPVSKDQPEQKLTSSSELKSLFIDAEVDKTVRKGAVSLVYFSCFARNQDCGPESKKRKNCTASGIPQSSSESYESILLKQGDSSVDEYCVSSTPVEALGLDVKNSGVKLQRGRRMKDFRKEILPGLASLSRQEIYEDIKIMELALRSREYKKYRSRSDCTSSVRIRRPRPRRGGRRYCS